VEVWGVGSTSSNAAVADMQGVFTDGQHIFAVAGLGGTSACAQNPANGGAECYHLAISRTLNPLAQGIFGGGDQLPVANLISNPQSYTRLFFAPDCSWNLQGIYFTDSTSSDPNVISPGLWSYPIPGDATFFQPAAVAGGAARVAVTFDQLAELDPSCSAATVWSSACAAAASRACRYSYGFTAGFGPVQYVAPGATIICVGATEATATSETFATLQTYQSGCSSSSSTSVQCSAATDDACVAAGSVSGLPIEELSQTEAVFACLSSPAAVFTIDWSELTADYSGCSSSTAGTPGVCMPAADIDCQSRGYVSGFGVQQISATQAQITCLQ
jgi:hypothetical protein